MLSRAKMFSARHAARSDSAIKISLPELIASRVSFSWTGRGKKFSKRCKNVDKMVIIHLDHKFCPADPTYSYLLATRAK